MAEVDEGKRVIRLVPFDSGNKCLLGDDGEIMADCDTCPEEDVVLCSGSIRQILAPVCKAVLKAGASEILAERRKGVPSAYADGVVLKRYEGQVLAGEVAARMKDLLGGREGFVAEVKRILAL